MGEAGGWDSARRVLSVRLDALGDVLLTTPALRAIKNAVTGRWVTLLTSRSGSEAASLVPEIDEVIVYDAPWMKASAPSASRIPDLAMVKHLRRRQFDAAVIFTVYSQSPLPAALLCYLAEIPLRAAHCRENPYQLLTRWVRESDPGSRIRHEVQRQLDLAAALGAQPAGDRLSLRIPEDARARVRRLLGSMGLHDGARWVVVHPGATAASRRYAWDRFAEVVRRLVRNLGWEVVLTGTHAEGELIARIVRASGVKSHELVGSLALGELAALLEEAPLLISNNTGPVHVAAAVGTPAVVLYALTNPQHTPWGVPSRVLFHDVPCRYCYRSVCPEGHHDCLRMVTPETVVDAARELMEDLRRPTAPGIVSGGTLGRRPTGSVPTAAAIPHAGAGADDNGAW